MLRDVSNKATKWKGSASETVDVETQCLIMLFRAYIRRRFCKTFWGNVGHFGVVFASIHELRKTFPINTCEFMRFWGRGRGRGVIVLKVPSGAVEISGGTGIYFQEGQGEDQREGPAEICQKYSFWQLCEWESGKLPARNLSYDLATQKNESWGFKMCWPNPAKTNVVENHSGARRIVCLQSVWDMCFLMR